MKSFVCSIAHALALGAFVIFLVTSLGGCATSPELNEAYRIVAHQNCVQKTGSYVECRTLEVYK